MSVYLLDNSSNFLVDGSGNRLTADITTAPPSGIFPLFLGLLLRLWS
jgi:hypothetical protein